MPAVLQIYAHNARPGADRLLQAGMGRRTSDFDVCWDHDQRGRTGPILTPEVGNSTPFAREV
jgi:hypothetical protein